MNALAIPVTVFVAPGPDVTKHTPTLPETLAYPSAACMAPCSCRTKIFLIFLLYSSSKMSSTAPPGNPKIVSTFSFCKASKRTCAPVNFTFLYPLLKSPPSMPSTDTGVKDGFPDKTCREISPKKNRYLLAGNGLLTANYVLNANHHPALLWKGMIIPIIIMMMFAILNACMSLSILTVGHF